MRVSLLLAGGACAAVSATAANVHLFGSALDKQTSFEAKCDAFKSKIDVANATVHSVTYVPVGANVSMADNPAVCSSSGDSAASSFEFCRIALNVTTSSESQIFMEAWLPRNYSGRFLSTGNGGLGGCMFLPILRPNIHPYTDGPNTQA